MRVLRGEMRVFKRPLHILKSPIEHSRVILWQPRPGAPLQPPFTMAVAAQDPLTRVRKFLTEKPDQVKQAVDAWTSKQPLWVEGAVAGLTGSFQVRSRR